jgi:hypothetical protein
MILAIHIGPIEVGNNLPFVVIGLRHIEFEPHALEVTEERVGVW